MKKLLQSLCLIAISTVISAPLIAQEGYQKPPEVISKLIEASNNKPQLIFKHSTRCGVSRMVLKQFESDFNLAPRRM